ncbi:hypothetical protein R3X27_10465 [Tropicimonas sp. TH_r6]|uniref:hypothetical protein n=1 Tax=Tropicimonas sp. TH_r6 TaxID=3082085 RepID=UPI002952BD34|nr:hypothetical protein [Tropicimonas sp. TH_r6]MDV7143106.1 hypothetical protein [Tropicimonas sp. TH_r6]
MFSDLKFPLRAVARFCLAGLFASLASVALAQSETEDFYLEMDAPVAAPVDVPVEVPVPSYTPMPTLHQSLPGVVPVFVPELSLDQLGVADVTAGIDAARNFCSSLPDEYRIDCLAEQLERVAKSLPKTAESREMRKILHQTSDKLEKVVRENRDRSKPRISAKSATAPAPTPSRPQPAPIATSRPLKAVKTEALPTAEAEAAAILEEAGILLLRSSTQSQETSQHYQAVAEALDSTALLLRS